MELSCYRLQITKVTVYGYYQNIGPDNINIQQFATHIMEIYMYKSYPRFVSFVDTNRMATLLGKS